MVRLHEFDLKKIFITLGILVLLGGAGVYSYQYYRSHRASKGNSEITSLMNEVGKLIQLPTGEVPTIATVTDKSKLQDQPIFRLAENGDKIIIYVQARKAILYRPSIKKIIDVVPVNAVPSPTGARLEPTQTATDSAALPTPAITRVGLYNGTDQVELTKKYQTIIEEEFTSADVTITDSASKSTYEKTVIVDISHSSPDMLSQLSSRFKATVSELPEGETAPSNTDILIIFGTDAR